MKKLLSFSMVILLLLPFLLAGCGGGQGSLVVYNWADYIDEEVLELFTKETGIKVEYANFTKNEEMYAKISRNAGNYDVIVPSDYIIERMIREDLLEPIDTSKLANFSNIRDNLKNPDYDPGSRYSVPYMWGTVGILYNTEMVDEEITSWGSMWDLKYEKNVLMMDSMRDTLGVTLKYLGYDINTRDPEHLAQARDLLIEQRTSGVLLAYGVDEIKDKLIGGEAALGLVWSGDALYSIGENENLAYVVPDEGSNIWIDGLCIPKSAKNKENALKFIDFMMRPDIAAMNSEYIGYSTPNMGALEILGEEYTEDAIFNPPQDVIDRCQFFHDLEDFTATYDRIWQEITAFS